MTTHCLAAILAADVVGLSALMGRDEEGTLSKIKRLRRDVSRGRSSPAQMAISSLVLTGGSGGILIDWKYIAAKGPLMPPAARVTDMHTCPMVTVLVPHVGGPIIPPCCPTVIVGGVPQARVGDIALCTGPPDVIVKGSATVLVGGMPAARIGDLTAHGGVIVTGHPTVLIGG